MLRIINVRDDVKGHHNWKLHQAEVSLNKQLWFYGLTSTGIFLGLIGSVFIIARYQYLVNQYQANDFSLLMIVAICATCGLILGWFAYRYYENSVDQQITEVAAEIKDQDTTNQKSQEFKEVFDKTNLPPEETQPITSSKAAIKQEEYATKIEYEETTSQHTFEDPEVGIKEPGHKIVDTPATLFSQSAPEEPEKPELPDDSFSKKRLVNVPLRPGPPPNKPKATI